MSDKPHGRVDADAARLTLGCANVQDAWTEYCIIRLRRGVSPGCNMREFGAWWDRAKQEA